MLTDSAFAPPWERYGWTPSLRRSPGVDPVILASKTESSCDSSLEFLLSCPDAFVLNTGQAAGGHKYGIATLKQAGMYGPCPVLPKEYIVDYIAEQKGKIGWWGDDGSINLSLRPRKRLELLKVIETTALSVKIILQCLIAFSDWWPGAHA